jgi:hypothetical protein
MLTLEKARELLMYAPGEGVLINLKSRRCARAGSYDSGKNRKIAINGITYQKTAVIWLLHYGVWPDKHVDHINRDPYDNRICNLRLASWEENNRNRSDKRSRGQRGVLMAKNRWVARITVNKKLIQLGSFKTFAEAKAAYDEAQTKYHGEFAYAAR